MPRAHRDLLSEFLHSLVLALATIPTASKLNFVLCFAVRRIKAGFRPTVLASNLVYFQPLPQSTFYFRGLLFPADPHPDAWNAHCEIINIIR